MYVEVSIPIALFKSFTYIVPNKYKDNIFLGQSVLIPFKNQKINGFITAIKPRNTYKGKLLNIIAINNNSFFISPELWKTLNWIAKYYITPIGQVLNNTISYQHKKKYQIPLIKYATLTKKGIDQLNNIKFPAQKKILTLLFNASNYTLNINKFKKAVSSYIQVCNKLEKNKYIQIKIEKNIDGILFKTQSQASTINLNNTQKKILKNIRNDLKSNYKKPIMLSGVPGSGKTIIYTKMVESYILNNQSVIILVPEISLIQQTYHQISNIYKKKVGIWHSKLSQSEKNYVLESIKCNKIKIIVGTRSSLFMPFINLGLIIVDEEQEFSYKQDLNAPYYHARDVALMRAKFSNSSLLLVSSAPSIESYFNIKQGKYSNHVLKQKYFKSKNTKVRLVEMSNQKGILSDILIKNIENTLKNNNQIILLQNKKGIEKGGIQKVESILYKFFPNVKILRYDGDSVKGSKSYYDILNTFKKGGANILLGTQMVGKGLDFKNVSLVGIISADIGLFIPDFRSGEKTFQTIYQLIGRAGRGNKESTAIIQSNNINDFYIKTACELKLEENFNQILKDRKELNYPPYSKLIKILFLAKKESDAEKKSQHFLSILNTNSKIQILGPAKAPIEYIDPYWRYQILIKCKKEYWQKFHDWIRENIIDLKLDTVKQKIKIDVDPLSTL